MSSPTKPIRLWPASVRARTQARAAPTLSTVIEFGPQAERGAVDLDDGAAAGDCFRKVFRRRELAGGNDDAVDLLLEQEPNRLLLERKALVAVGDDDAEAPRLNGVGDAADHRGIEGARDVRRDDADRLRAAGD